MRKITRNQNKMHVSRATLSLKVRGWFFGFFLTLYFKLFHKRLSTRIQSIFDREVFVLFFFDCDNLGSNTVQIPSSLRTQSASTIRVLFHQFKLFQILEAFTGNTSGASAPM